MIGKLPSLFNRLFPATTREPHTTFTISLLKEFQPHNLESTKAAYDYLAAMRLSDNSFTADVPVCSPLNQSQRTLDGNFQCNQFNKNADPNDISLCAGKGYFPIDSEYKEPTNCHVVSMANMCGDKLAYLVDDMGDGHKFQVRSLSIHIRDRETYRGLADNILVDI
ncbi:hypothetical protein B0H13DRAFT_1875822 [Mycena leptocephala]|nr:hypothetical protein B0H13DRAFT_1875822 [Mycena leptocephala]